MDGLRTFFKDTEVTFAVGKDEEIIPARMDTLALKSPVFKVMFEGSMADQTSKLIRIDDVDPKAFEIFISFMNGEDIKFRSVWTALSVIYASKKYMVRILDTLALSYIQKNITCDNVLIILENIFVLYDRDREKNFESSRPLKYPNQKDQVNDVLNLCFVTIDKSAEKILESDEIEDTSLEVLKAILRRERLNVKSEALVWHAVHRWSRRQCQRRHLQPTEVNKRKVLEGAQYLVRYLTMSLADMKKTHSLLTRSEKKSILERLLDRRVVLVETLQEYQGLISTPRVREGCCIKRIAKMSDMRGSKMLEKLVVLLVCVLD